MNQYIISVPIIQLIGPLIFAHFAKYTNIDQIMASILFSLSLSYTGLTQLRRLLEERNTMIGPFINSGAIILGGAIGALIKGIIPKQLEKGLIPAFGLIALGIGITMVIKVNFLPAVVFALIFGIIIGELLSLERSINRNAERLQKQIGKLIPAKEGNISPADFSTQFSALVVLFTFSGMGILGSLTEGITGEFELLLIKASLDFFTAMIFAMTLGPAVMLIFISQLTIQTALFFLAKFIMPYIDKAAFGDFSACGGIIMLGLGLRITKIKEFKVVNFLPALVLVIPFSYLWRYFFPG